MSELHLLIHSALQQIWREHPLGASELCAGETKVAWQPSLEDLPCGGRGRCVGAEPPHCIVSAGDTGAEQAEQGGQKLAPGKPHSGGRKKSQVEGDRKTWSGSCMEARGQNRTHSYCLQGWENTQMAPGSQPATLLFTLSACPVERGVSY